MSRATTDPVGLIDVLYFTAELAVYVVVAWWGFSRSVPAVGREALGLAAIIAFAAAWGMFAAPNASLALHGVAGVTFRIVWFGLGAAAGSIVILGR
jgi:hypothetical protein